jgi:hypothetical protein
VADAKPTPKLVEMSKLNDGVAEEFWREALLAVLANIEDPNTAWDAKRKINLTFTIQPTDEDRRSAYIAVECSTKLAGVKPAASVMFIGRHEGMPAAIEAARQSDMFPKPNTKPAPVQIAVEKDGTDDE